jgi:thioredoxin:protein disulfide reductase
LRPLQPLTTGRDAFKAGSIAWRHVQDIKQLDAALADAGGKPVLLDFYADWCVSCTEMDRFTFTDPQVLARLAAMQLLRVDVTSNSAQDRALLKRFHLFGPRRRSFWIETAARCRAVA